MADRAEAEAREAGWIRRVVLLDDHEAFAELVRLHQAPVRRFLRRLTGNDPDRADDLAQETFWKAYRHLETFEGRGRFLSWLFRIAYQEYVTSERRRPRLTQVEMPADLASEQEGDRAFVTARTFDQLLAALRSEERAALLLHYRHELSHTEVATALNVPLGTVKTLLRRARLRLGGAREGGGES